MSNILKHTKRGLTAFLFALLVTLFLLGSQVALAASWKVVSCPSPGTGGDLNAVAALSASDIWAVGSYSNGSGSYPTLIEHWNGTSWKVIASPNVGTSSNALNAVAALSASNVWAVGFYRNSNGPVQPLIEHWNGTNWKVVSSPSPGTSGQLNAVTALSASNVWTVGYYQNSSGFYQTLIEHWNGTSWNVVSSPNPGTSINQLYGLAALSASNIWTVGYYQNSSGPAQTLIEHWNGTNWKVVSSPNPGTRSNVLLGVAALSASNIWTVGYYYNGNGPAQTLIEHWNGTSWQVVASPNPGTGSNLLYAVAALSASNIWTVGYYYNGNGPTQTLIEHWNGASWQVVSSPSPGTVFNELYGVAALSASDIWAVGVSIGGDYRGQTLTEQYS